jgi:hypothetical protein
MCSDYESTRNVHFHITVNFNIYNNAMGTYYLIYTMNMKATDHIEQQLLNVAPVWELGT